MKSRPFSKEQYQQFDTQTSRLSVAARGVWISARMQMCAASTYVLEDTVEQLGLLLRCPIDLLLTVLEEFAIKTLCGFRVEKPPPYKDRTECVRLVYEPDEKGALLSSSESLRLSKYREDKKNKEKKKMPENWNLSERMKEYGITNGMSTTTVQHEFEKCRTHHLENLHTDLGWEFRVFQTWVLNWVTYGRKQVLANGSTDRPPPYPPKNDPIARGMWSKAYGDPAKWGYG